MVGTTGVRLVETGGLVVVEACEKENGTDWQKQSCMREKITCDETRNAKRSSPIGLGVTLLQTGNMSKTQEIMG